ncbi:plasmid fertility inhibition factor family protein [Cupriavidus taiwanensis]|uniref:plasmid fertility inhibition factor family protein n=1 Tax=Cupriavidus taiwanensis TaxID=164546 RepID=UPI000E108368|nr:hypothetical protein [Cupriavidus taiwanensis]SOZ12788.1 protein of unknown function [Cupriavidus taiwanensis]SOZ41280.1 protein of unknown function [Cupriavidus taiwanensis]
MQEPVVVRKRRRVVLPPVSLRAAASHVSIDAPVSTAPAVGGPPGALKISPDTGSAAPALLCSLPKITGGDIVFRVERDSSRDDARAVVIVEASRFLAIWQREPGFQYGSLLQDASQAWRADPRFEEAAAQCRGSAQLPIPIPRVQCLRHMGERIRDTRRLLRRPQDANGAHTYWFAVVDSGAYHLIWMLEQGVIALPVECDVSQAFKLQQAAGLPGTDPATVPELMRRYRRPAG